MKLKSLITCLLLSLTAIVSAQQPAPLRQESRERIESQRIAYITMKLNLSPDEAAKFWPVYNEHKEKLKDLRDETERPDLLSVTDAEASGILERHLQMEEKKLELKRGLYAKLKNILPPRKILMLHAAEKEFNRELLSTASFRMDHAKINYNRSKNFGKE